MNIKIATACVAGIAMTFVISLTQVRAYLLARWEWVEDLYISPIQAYKNAVILPNIY